MDTALLSTKTAAFRSRESIVSEGKTDEVRLYTSSVEFQSGKVQSFSFVCFLSLFFVKECSVFGKDETADPAFPFIHYQGAFSF